MRFLLLACSLTMLVSCSGKTPDTQAAPSGLRSRAAGRAPLALAGAVNFPGFSDDFDHFAIDQKDGNLFLAGEGGAELEVIDLATGTIKTRMKGFGAPHSLLYLPESDELLVVDGEKPSVVLDAKSLQVKRRYLIPKEADLIGWDGSSGHVWIVVRDRASSQKGADLIELDPATGKTVKSVPLEADYAEALAVEQSGSHLFINVTARNSLDVIDKDKGAIIKKVPISGAEQNSPLALDERNHRIFVVTRKPGKLIVLDSITGQTIASMSAPGHADQAIWDPQSKRIYVTGGEGYISVVHQDSPDRYREIGQVKSLPGAKTAILDSTSNRLWVAVSPGQSKAMAKVLWYDVAS